jgi:hypothetical protein
MKTQSDKNLDFNGMKGDGVNRAANRLAKNQWSGHSNDGRLVNFKRGPTVGNQDYDVMQGAHREPPTRALPAVKPGKDMFTGREQYRGQGGVTAKCPANPDKQNYGRGPTKGNQ